MIDESSSLRGVFSKLEAKNITQEKKNAKYAAIEAMLDGDGSNKLLQSLEGLNVCGILARDITTGSPRVMSILSIVIRILEANIEMVTNPSSLLGKLVMILESNLSEQKSTDVYVKALKCISLMCPAVKSLGKEGAAIKSILPDICNQNTDVSVKIEALSLFKSLSQYKLLEDGDSNGWLKILVNSVFGDDASLRDVAVEALSIFKVRLTGNEEYLDTLANLVPVKCSKMLIEMIPVDKNWAVIWRLLVDLLGKRLHTNSTLVNSLLAVEEKAFKSSSMDTKKDAFNCWNTLVFNFALEHNVLSTDRRVKLLTIPLRANNCRHPEIALVKLNVWWNTIRYMKSDVTNYSDMVLHPFLSFCYGLGGELNHMSSNGQNRLNGSNAVESSAKLYPVIRVPCLHALCEILSRSAGMPLPVALAKELAVPSLLAPPITNQKVFCSLSRFLTMCLGEAVILGGYDLLQTPYIIHCWQSLLVLVGRGTGDSSANDSYSKDLKNISMVKELLRLLVNLVESSSVPEGKSIGPVILSMIECIVAGECAFPTSVLTSHTYAVGNFLVMNSSPHLLLSVLFLSPVFSNDKQLYPRVKEVFSKVLSIGLNGAISPLPFARGLLKKLDACASEQFSTVRKSYLQEIWILMANHLSDAINKDGAISEGNDAGHDFHCIHGMLMFPLSHFLKSNLPQDSLEPVIKSWKKLFELYFINAELLVTTQSSDVIEELCRKIHVAFKKSAISLTSIANAIQFVLIMYRKPFCETYWKGHTGQASKGEKEHGLCSSQQLLIILLYKISNFLSSREDQSDSDEENMSDHRSIISFLVLIFTSATSFNFSSFTMDKGLMSVSYYLKVTAENKYKLSLGDEMIKLWENFLEYMEKKVLVVPGKTQSTVDSLSPLFISALKHPLTKLANVTVLHWNRSLGELCSKVKISKSLSDTLDDVMKDSSGSEDVLGKMPTLDKSSRILAKPDKNESPSKSMFNVPVATLDKSCNVPSAGNCSEFKIIPPKFKSPVLTEHQKEMRKERRVDIPALYQDLTQDSVSQSFSQENSVAAAVKPAPGEFGEEDANSAFPMELLAKQNFQSVRKMAETKAFDIHAADERGNVSNITLNSTPAGDKKLEDVASAVTVEMEVDSFSCPTGKASFTGMPDSDPDSKVCKKRKRKQQLNITAHTTPTDSTETMHERSVVLPTNISETGLPIREKDQNLDVVISSPSTAAVVSDIAASIPPADDVLVLSASNQETGKLTADAKNVNDSSGQGPLPKDLIQDLTPPKISVEEPEKSQSQLQKSKINDVPHSSSAPEAAEDLDTNTTSSPSGTLNVDKKHTRKSIPKKITNLQCLKNITMGSTKENESPSGSSIRKESPSVPCVNTPNSVKRRGRPRSRTVEEQSCRENVDSVDGPLRSETSSTIVGNLPTEESVQESSKDTRGSNLRGKSNECKNQNTSSSSHSQDIYEKHSEITSRVLPETVLVNCGSGVASTISERLEKDSVGFTNIKTSPGKLSDIEFSSSSAVEAKAPSSCVDLGINETVGPPKSVQASASPKSKLLPGSPRLKSAGNSPNLDKWVIVTKRESDEKSPKKLHQNLSSPSKGNVKVITLNSHSDDASDVVMTKVGNDISCMETPMTSNSEDLVDSSQDPLDSSISSVKCITKKCAVHLPRVCDSFPNEVTFIPYEGRMLKCNLSPSKSEDVRNESEQKKTVLPNSSPIATNLFSSRNSNSRGARILSMAQGNKEKTSAEENCGPSLGDMDSKWLQQNNSSNLQDSPLSHPKSTELNLTPPMKKPRRIRSLYLGNVSPQYHALEIGCVASESEVAVHSYSPNASPGGSLMKRKRPLESDDSISPSSKKLRRVSFADPIVSRQVEFCIPESERKFKKRAVSRCLKLPCMPQDESTEIMPYTSQLRPAKPLSNICDVKGANSEGEMMSSAELGGLNQSNLENLEEKHDVPVPLTSKLTLESKLAEIHGLTCESGNSKEVDHSTGELMSLNEVDKSENGKSKNFLPVEECGSDEGASNGSSLINASAALLIEKESCRGKESVIQGSPKKTEIHNSAKKEMAENVMPKFGYGNSNDCLKRATEYSVSSQTQTEQSVGNIDCLKKVVNSSPSGRIKDAPLLEPASSLEIQASPEIIGPMEESLESLSTTEKLLDSFTSSESLDMSITESVTEEPRIEKLNSQEEVFPALRDCKDPLSSIIGSLTSKIWRERCRISLENKGIRTIGDLSRLTEDLVERIPIKYHKWNTLKSVLEGYYKLKCKENKSSSSTSSVQVNGPCEMEVEDDIPGMTFSEMLSQMSSKDIFKELKTLNLTDSLLQEIENEKRSTLSQNIPNTKEKTDEPSKSQEVSGTVSKIGIFPAMKSSEILQSVIERSDLKETVSGLPLEKVMQLLKCAVSTAHKKVPTFDGSVDIAARRILQCVINELMDEGGSVDMVKQLSWIFLNTLFSKEYVKSIPSLLNIVDSSVVSELILKQENIMENMQNQMSPAKAIKIAVGVLSQKNVSLLPEDDLNELNDVLDSSRTCEELFDRFTRIIKERLSGNHFIR